MTTGQIKLLTLIFALVNVWLLFHIPAISEATLKFISVGEIPGTGKSLSPDVMLYLAIGSFVVAVVLVFWREFRKVFKRRTKQPAFAQMHVPVTPVAVQAPIPVVAVPAVSRRTGKKPPVVRPQVFVAPRIITATMASAERRTAKLFAALRRQIVAVGISLTNQSKRLARRSKLLAISFWKWLVPQAKRTWALLVRMTKAAHLLILDGWQWAEPRIRAFDRWLEKQLHQNKATADALKIGGQLSATVTARLRKVFRFAKNTVANARKAWRTTNE